MPRKPNIFWYRIIITQKNHKTKKKNRTNKLSHIFFLISSFSSRSSSITSIRSTYAGSEANSYDCFLIHRDDFPTENQQFDTVDNTNRTIDDDADFHHHDLIEEPNKCNKFDDKENINSEKSQNKTNNKKNKKHRKKRSDSEYNNSCNNLIESNCKNGKMPPTTTKLPGRQTNNSLSSITGQIIIQTPPPTPQSAPNNAPSTSRKKKTKTEVWVTEFLDRLDGLW